jgi:hypothetical protein
MNMENNNELLEFYYRGYDCELLGLNPVNWFPSEKHKAVYFMGYSDSENSVSFSDEELLKKFVKIY